MSGVTGNIAVCLVIVKNKSMHTATNYYLFSLACSDLMMLVLGESKGYPLSTSAKFWICGPPFMQSRILSQTDAPIQIHWICHASLGSHS